MPYCERCDRRYRSKDDLRRHEENSSHHHICYDCDKDYPSKKRLIQHYVRSSRHAYCEECDKHFDEFDELDDHFEDEHYWCRLCDKVRPILSSPLASFPNTHPSPCTLLKFYPSEDRLHSHRFRRHINRYCALHRRMFQNNNNLRQHQRSAAHVPRDVRCPLPHCDASFVSRSALIQHFESGTCASRITRHTVDELIAQFDKHCVITQPSRRLAHDSMSDRERDTREPNGGAATETITGVWATSRAWNGRAYECYLCGKGFRALDALNAHLKSPVHAQKRYRCPRRWGGCGAEFVTLSGFCQHVESEQCGVRRFKRKMDRIIDDLGSARRVEYA